MRRALELAESGWGRVHPNPLVGAVVVRDGGVVGEGAHREFGGDHAEVEALRNAGEQAHGATLYVTLEPCSHTGKTPPCTDSVVRAGVERVVIAAEDPHPRAAGGARRLEQAGVEVVTGVERDAARAQNALFLRPLETGRPFVALKFGMTLDARIARRAGQQTRITGDAAEGHVHRLRSGFEAIMVGAATARIDDPRLTVRHAPRPRIPPVRVVVDPKLSLSPDSRLARSVDEAPVWVLAHRGERGEGRRALESRGVDVVEVPAVAGSHLLDLDAALDALHERGIRTVLCEGGGRLGAALLEAERVDRLYLFIAPDLLGTDGVPAFPGTTAFRGGRVQAEPVGRDVLLTVDRSG